MQNISAKRITGILIQSNLASQYLLPLEVRKFFTFLRLFRKPPKKYMIIASYFGAHIILLTVVRGNTNWNNFTAGHTNRACVFVLFRINECHFDEEHSTRNMLIAAIFHVSFVTHKTIWEEKPRYWQKILIYLVLFALYRTITKNLRKLLVDLKDHRKFRAESKHDGWLIIVFFRWAVFGSAVWGDPIVNHEKMYIMIS